MRTVAALAALVPLLTACDAVGPRDPRLLELEVHRARWDSLGPDSYEYAVERMCFCPTEYIGPVRVRVEDGQVVDRAYVDSGVAVTGDAATAFPSVEGLFDLLRSAMERDADRIDATYDPDLGVPVDFWIDYSEMAVDEELGMRVTEAVSPIP